MVENPNQTIFHVDINSYFASILQQVHPELRGKPIGVVKDRGRTCLIAASKEAKTYGVTTGMLIKEARPLCPQIECVPADFDLYLAATKKLKEIFNTFSPAVYIYSLDEAFIDLTSCLHYVYPSVDWVAQNIKKQIAQQLGEWVTCNIGISYNRLLAKLASEMSPPDSIIKITSQNLDAVLATATLEQVCGIGYRLQKKLQLFNIQHPYQIRFLSTAELSATVGKFWTQELQKIAYGQEPHHLALLDNRPLHMKQVSRSITGYTLCKNEDMIRQVLLNLTAEIALKVRQMQLAGRRVGLSFKGSLHNRDHHWHRYLTVKHHLQHTSDIFNIIYHQLYTSWHHRFPIIRFRVSLGLLKSTNQLPSPLFLKEQRQQALTTAVDTINQRYGLFTVRPATLAPLQELIKPEVTGFLGDRQYYGL